MTIRLITPPTEEPVTLEEAKAQCRIDLDDEDAMINVLITAAREQCEHILGRSLLTQTWLLTTNCFDRFGMKLFYPKISEVEFVKYLDSSGTEVTLDPALYVVDSDSEPGIITCSAWPQTFIAPNAVRIQYVAGYEDVDAVPSSIKQWILIAVATLYKSRESYATGTITTLPRDFMAGLLDRHIIWSI